MHTTTLPPAQARSTYRKLARPLFTLLLGPATLAGAMSCAPALTAIALAATHHAPAYPLCDANGAPACGNIGQTGRPSPARPSTQPSPSPSSLSLQSRAQPDVPWLEIGATALVGVGVAAGAAALILRDLADDSDVVPPAPISLRLPPSPAVPDVEQPQPAPLPPLPPAPAVPDAPALERALDEQKAREECREQDARPIFDQWRRPRRDAQGHALCANIMSKRG